MSTTRFERTYRCWDDCLISGCPTHVATLEFQSTSSMMTFDDGRGQRITNYPNAFQALVSMLVNLAGRRSEAGEVLTEGLRGSDWYDWRD